MPTNEGFVRKGSLSSPVRGSPTQIQAYQVQARKERKNQEWALSNRNRNLLPKTQKR